MLSKQMLLRHFVQWKKIKVNQVKTKVNKAIVDYTSPALCTPVTPFAADPIFSERGSDGMIPCAA